MEFNAKKYNNSNKLQIRDAKELLDKIVAENPNDKYDVILDIGCGTGNVTLLLAGALKPNKIYALDVDKEMIDFANRNHSEERISYLIQDFGCDFRQLSPELQAIEGRVSLIFSNHCFHWIRNKENVVKNLYRLLSKRGKIYCNIYWVVDPYTHLTPEEKAIHVRDVMDVPTKELQFNIWSDLFKSNEFNIIFKQFFLKECHFDSNTFEESILPLSITIRKLYFIRELTAEESDEIKAIAVQRCRHFMDETTGETMVDFKYGFFQFILNK